MKAKNVKQDFGRQKMVLYISGGVLQGCSTNMKNIDFVLIDADNLEAEGYSGDEIDTLSKKECKGLKGIYPDCPSPKVKKLAFDK